MTLPLPTVAPRAGQPATFLGTLRSAWRAAAGAIALSLPAALTLAALTTPSTPVRAQAAAPEARAKAGATKPRPPAPAPARAASAAPTAAPALPGVSIAAPAAWVQALPLEPVPATLAPAPVQYPLIDRQTRVGSTPAQTQRYHRAVRWVRDAAGLDAAAKVEVEFDPSYQRVVLHTVTLERDGRRTERLDAAALKLLHREPQLERQMVDGRMTAVMVLQDVRVGDRVDWSYTLVGSNPVFGERFVDNEWMFAQGGSTAVYRYRLLAPAGRDIRHRTGGPDTTVSRATLADGTAETVFLRRNVPLHRHDTNAPVAVYLPTMLQLSEFADWAEVAAWAQRQFDGAVAPGPLVRERAAAIRAAHAEPAERLRAALDLVQGEVRYFGTENGINSHRPARAEDVLRQRYGDCKDKTALLMSLAGELGLPAQALLVAQQMRRDIAGLLPSPLAFDHAIAGVELDGRVLWLDGTRPTQTGPAAARVPVGLGWGLPARAGTTALVAMPAAAGTLRLEVEDRVEVDDFARPVRFTSGQTFHGDLAELWRLARASMPAADFEQQLSADLLRAHPTLEADGPAEVADVPGQNALRVTRRFRWTTPWRFPEERSLQTDFVLWGLMAPLRLPDQGPRSQPLAIAFPGLYRHELRWSYPEAVFGRSSASQAEERAGAFTVELKYESTERSQRIRGELQLNADRIEPADWTRHRDALMKAWPRMSGTLTLPSIKPATSERLRTDQAELMRRMAGLRTQVQRDALFGSTLLAAQLADGRLAPPLQAQALLARARHLDHLGRHAEGHVELLRAQALKPGDAELLGALAVNAFGRGADAEALAHTEAALAARPQDAAPRYVRAYVHYFGDAPARARDELNLVLAQSGEAERGYAPIWLYLADRRAGGDGETAVSRHLEERPRSAWPHPVLDHLRGRLDVDALLRAARAAGTDPGPQVEAWFYAGQKALLDGDLARARKCFQEAQALGVVEYNEHGMALRALKSLVRR